MLLGIQVVRSFIGIAAASAEEVLLVGIITACFRDQAAIAEVVTSEDSTVVNNPDF